MSSSQDEYQRPAIQVYSAAPSHDINPNPREEEIIPNPYSPRFNIAVSAEHPRGTHDWADKHKGQTVLQQHVSFFDRDDDGVIYPSDTYRGLRDLGWNVLLSILAVWVIHSSFSYFTLPASFRWWPDPFFRIYVQQIHRAHHGSSTGIYDRQGRFVPAEFEGMFQRYDHGSKGGLTLREAFKLGRANREVADLFGWFAEAFEWVATYILLWPVNGVMKKDDIRRVFDGSIFFEIRDKRIKEGKQASSLKKND